MNGTTGIRITFIAAAAIAWAADADAYRMIRNTAVGRVSNGTSVTCGDAIGFAHWTKATIAWRLNPARQGSKPGMETALRNAMASWNSVSPAAYTLSYAGTTNQGFATDGTNTAVWGTGSGCTGGCLALTALVLQAGQVITEVDFILNDAVSWSANGSDYDAQAIMAHELGHSLGIHHTEVKQKHNRPTMYSSYFGTDGRSLSSDDQAALNCAYSRYPVLALGPIAIEDAVDELPEEPAIALAARTRDVGANLRISLPREGQVKLEIFDVAGRHLETVLSEWRGPGEHEVAWNGSTRFGQARPGVYFARALTPGAKATATVVLAH